MLDGWKHTFASELSTEEDIDGQKNLWMRNLGHHKITDIVRSILDCVGDDSRGKFHPSIAEVNGRSNSYKKRREEDSEQEKLRFRNSAWRGGSNEVAQKNLKEMRRIIR